jgi:hypothetical protein
MKKILAIALIVLPSVIVAKENSRSFARLTESQVMFTSDAAANFSSCQPLKGSKVEKFEAGQKFPALEVVRVRVIDGECANQEGWVGLARLESVDP